jgi:hypothetical protein
MIQALALAGAQLACLNFIQYEITIEQFNGNALYSAGTRKSILTTRIQSLSFELKRLMRSWRLLPDFVNTRVLSERRQHDGYHQRLRLSLTARTVRKKQHKLRSQDNRNESLMSLVIFVGTSR